MAELTGDPTMQLTLAADDTAAVLDSLGGRLVQLTVRGHDLLAPERDVRTQAGCYPMTPWAGRLGEGRFSFGGVGHRVPITMPPHAIHGLATAQEWEVIGPGRMSLSFEGLWPLGGSTSVEYDLRSDRIVCTLTVTAGEQPMPAVIGWHPCFVRDLDGHRDILTFHAGHMWTRGDDYLPTGDRQDVPPGPWDDCFGDVEGAPHLSWGETMAIELRSPTTTWVVFDMLESIICVEPQTDTPNAFNLGGGATLQPGRSLELPLEIAW